jgi:hypothetical protein
LESSSGVIPEYPRSIPDLFIPCNTHFHRIFHFSPRDYVSTDANNSYSDVCNTSKDEKLFPLFGKYGFIPSFLIKKPNYIEK